jgi:hypothetical protein
MHPCHHFETWFDPYQILTTDRVSRLDPFTRRESEKQDSRLSRHDPTRAIGRLAHSPKRLNVGKHTGRDVAVLAQSIGAKD